MFWFFNKVDCGANFFILGKNVFGVFVETILTETSFKCKIKSMKCMFFDFDNVIFLQINKKGRQSAALLTIVSVLTETI